MILTAGNMCRLYILYDNYCPLFSDLFLLCWVISFEWLISWDETATGTRVRQRPLTGSLIRKSSRKPFSLADLSFVLLLSCLLCCFPALFVAFCIWLCYLTQQRCPDEEKLRKCFYLDEQIIKSLSLILLKRQGRMWKVMLLFLLS